MKSVTFKVPFSSNTIEFVERALKQHYLLCKEFKTSKSYLEILIKYLVCVLISYWFFNLAKELIDLFNDIKFNTNSSD